MVSRGSLASSGKGTGTESPLFTALFVTFDEGKILSSTGDVVDVTSKGKEDISPGKERAGKDEVIHEQE